MIKHTIATGLAAALVAASTTFAMAQATGTENNATGGSGSSMESKGSGKMQGDKMQGDMKNSSGSGMGDGAKTSAGTTDAQAKDLRGHSETPSTGSGK